jgi:hypothetical protein
LECAYGRCLRDRVRDGVGDERDSRRVVRRMRWRWWFETGREVQVQRGVGYTRLGDGLFVCQSLAN